MVSRIPTKAVKSVWGLRSLLFGDLAKVMSFSSGSPAISCREPTRASDTPTAYTLPQGLSPMPGPSTSQIYVAT